MKFEKYIVSPELSVKDAIARISETQKKAVYVADAERHLLGIFSDGDMRRYILANGDLTKPVELAMNPRPFVLHSDVREKLAATMRMEGRMSYPVVDAENRIVDIVFWSDIEAMGHWGSKRELPPGVSTVIMAGGLGKRLYPYTKVLPKALIPIGDKPILTRVMDAFMSFGVRDFHLIVNHKRAMIKAYYAEESLDCNLHYYDEESPLGPAGGLCYLKGKIHEAFFLSNCDILVDANYADVYDFHKKSNNLITAVAALRDVEVPYGVIHINGVDNRITSIEEKPCSSYLANVGVYVIEPEVLQHVEDGKVLLITDLINRYIGEGRRVGVYPVNGTAWMDMGQLDEMRKMDSAIGKQLTET